MVAPSTQDRLVLRRKLAAQPETVFMVWTQPEHMKRWFAPSEKYTNPFIEVDLRVGGKSRIGFRSVDGHTSVVGGEYRTVDPPNKLEFTWQWETPHEFDEHETLVTVEFLACDEGTELVLAHKRFPNEAMLGLHNQGWDGTLDRMVRTVAELAS